MPLESLLTDKLASYAETIRHLLSKDTVFTTFVDISITLLRARSLVIFSGVTRGGGADRPG